MLSEYGTIPSNYIDAIIENSEKYVTNLFGHCTLVALKLPNGYVISECSGCINLENYSQELGETLCMQKLRDDIWNLEGCVSSYEFSGKTITKDEVKYND